MWLSNQTRQDIACESGSEVSEQAEGGALEYSDSFFRACFWYK